MDDLGVPLLGTPQIKLTYCLVVYFVFLFHLFLATSSVPWTRIAGIPTTHLQGVKLRLDPGELALAR